MWNENDNDAAIDPEEETEEKKINLEMEEEIDCDDSAWKQFTDDIEACAEGVCCKENQGRFRCYYWRLCKRIREARTKVLQ